MPKRRQKRQDTSNSDDYDQQMNMQRKVHFGSVQINRFLPPDEIQGDDANKYSILAWSNTLQAQRLLPWLQRKQLFQRALKYLPNSYKIWHSYLTQFMQYCSTRSVYSKQYLQLNKTFELALQKLPRMPRIWLLYTQSLQKQHKISKIRQVFNWSFRNLPLTQHNKIWHKFSLWSMKLDNSNTALTVIPRYIKLNPDFKEQFVEYLKRRNMIEKCVDVILDILKDQGYYSKQGKSKKDFQYDIIDLFIQYPDKQSKVNGELMIKQCINKYPSQQGQLWVKLTDYYIRKGEFQSARSTFQSAISQIENTKDFGIIFNAYTKFQQQMITALANEQIQQYAQINKQDNLQYEIQQRLNKLQQIIDRQPYILCKINIKRTPNDVKAWLNYSELYYKKGEIEKFIDTINQAIQTIQPQKALNGMLSSLWIKLASIYQQSQQIRQCNQIFNQATHVNFKMVQDYFNIWIAWIQMLLEQQYYQDALKVVKHVLFRRKIKLKTLMIYQELTYHYGSCTFDNIKTAYERCKQHKCLTPIMLLNYTDFLWQNAFFQQTFRVFQFAVNSFKWPSLYQIWISYIHKFITRYGDDLVGAQRCRSMFQRLLKSCPIQHIGIFHYLYAKFQQQHGMISYSINIYDSMINKVPKEQRAKAYCLYICKVAKMLGITKTRAIFEAALQRLTEREILSIGKQYAQLQKNLGEIQRARAVYVYVSQFTDPRDDMDQLWQKWENFEVQNGDKQTYKEYLRIKRSVEAKFQMLPPDLAKIQEKVKKGLI